MKKQALSASLRRVALLATLSLGTGAVAADALPQAEGEVRKIDLATHKITLRHGDIPNLEMPPMTMVFKLADPALLGEVQVGDKVRFTADKVDGSYTVLSLDRQP